jgi:hypothetical protein
MGVKLKRSAFAHLVDGELLEVTGPLDEAELEYRRAAAIFPDPSSMMALAGVARRRGHTDDECAFLARLLIF